MELQTTELELNQQRIQIILEAARRENPQLQKVTETKLTKLIAQALVEIDRLEQVTKEHRRILAEGKLPIPAESLIKLKALWVLSGPGLYRQPFKQDRYKDKPWAQFMGRHRLAYAGMLMRRIAEAISGETPTPRNSQKQLLVQHAPYLIFNGREDENVDVKTILAEEGAIIPLEKVWIPETPIDKTIDQVKRLTLPPELVIQSGDEIGIISHTPHLMRVSHMLKRYKQFLPFPPDTIIRAFPLATPLSAVPEYHNQEVRGLLYYIFVTNEATADPYPFAV